MLAGCGAATAPSSLEDCDDRSADRDRRCDAGVDAARREDAQAERCGNDVIDRDEQCDRDNFNGATCESVTTGTRSGTLHCTIDCRFDTRNCPRR